MFKELILATQWELFYQRYLRYLRELNYNYIEMDGKLIACHDIIPTREEFLWMRGQHA